MRERGLSPHGLQDGGVAENDDADGNDVGDDHEDGDAGLHGGVCVYLE